MGGQGGLLPSIVSALIGSVGLSLAVLYSWTKFSELVENNIRPELRDRIGEWLHRRGERSALASEGSAQFVAVFDSVFGTKHLTLRCFLLSSAISVVAFLLLAMGVGILYWHSPVHLDPGSLLGTIGVAAVCNVVPDYVSLLETRILLGVLKADSRLGRVFAVLLVDIVLTFAITAVGLFVVACIYYGGVTRGAQSFVSAVTYLIWPPAKVEGFEHLGDEINLKVSLIVILTAFVTSIWLWLYLIGGALIRLRVGYQLFVRVMPVEERPLKSIGFAGGLVCAICYLVWYLVAAPLQLGQA